MIAVRARRAYTPGRAATTASESQSWATDLSVWIFFFFSSRRRHTRFDCDLSSDVCSSDWDGALGDERDGHRVGADALARDATGGMGGAEEGRRMTRLGAVTLLAIATGFASAGCATTLQ